MISLNSINSYYGKSHVLHDLSLEVPDGEIVLLLGRNGAGKTTTIRSIMGTIPELCGEIWYRDEDISPLTPDEVYERGIGWIPESRRIFSNLTVHENLKMGLQSHDDDAVFEDLFELFPRLEERLGQKAGTMSGGEQQMLAIARALSSEPELLLVDEPFEGLMPTLVTEVAEVLEELSNRDMSMLITEQYAEQALELADQVYIIDTGKNVFNGEPEEFIANPGVQERYLGVGQE